jgi:hypothetical protein
MLPLHGQDTAAVELSHWAGIASNTCDARGYVFGKQAGFVFAEFLLFLLIFP